MILVGQEVSKLPASKSEDIEPCLPVAMNGKSSESTSLERELLPHVAADIAGTKKPEVGCTGTFNAEATPDAIVLEDSVELPSLSALECDLVAVPPSQLSFA